MPGLPQVLPRGEHIAWQGQPDFRSLALGTFHIRELIVYFAILLMVRVGFQVGEGLTLAEMANSVFGLAMLAAVAVSLLLLYASHVARVTMYTFTNKRIIIRTGVAISVTINLPYKLVNAADLRLHKDGSGDIALQIHKSSRASYILLWPMVKPLRFLSVRPVVRGIPDAESVSALLANALAEYAADDDGVIEAAVPRKAEPLTGKQRLEALKLNWPLGAAAAMIVFSIIGVSLYQMSDARLDRGLNEASLASIELFFRDREDGGIDVVRAATGEHLETLDPGTNGFLRGTLRSFVRYRNAESIGSEIPFAIRHTESGRILLHDPATDQLIDLRAFGEINLEAFSRFLKYAEPDSKGTESGEMQQGVAALGPGEKE